MNSLKWGNPSGFYFIFLLVLWTVVFFLSKNKVQNKLKKHFGERVIPWLSSNFSAAKQLQIFSLQLIGLFFLVLALARPQLGQSQQEVKSEGVELMILADVSDSMLAEDVKPSRLEQMKVDLSKLVDLMPGNKMGLIAFAGSASLMSPLTSDPTALKMYIESLDTFAVSTQGTVFETALTYAKEAFDKGGVTQSQQVQTTRVILVVSDGEDHEQGALEVAKALAKDGIRIISVAYGTEKGATIPARDPYGNLVGSKKNKAGEVVMTTVKGDFLKQLAQEGQGSFYVASFGGNHLRSVQQDIDAFEKTQFESSMLVQYDEQFQWPLGFGLVFILLSFLLSDRKTTPLEWKGRYEI